MLSLRLKVKHSGGRVFSRPIYYPIYTPPLHSAKARNRNFFFHHQLQRKQQSLRDEGMISVQVPTSLCMQNKLIIHSRYCFVEQYVYPREPNIYTLKQGVFS